jgi:hypothetical protein
VTGTAAWRTHALRAASWVATAVALPIWAVAAAVGGLYLLYRGGLLGVGPGVPGALPLEGLAGHAGQPLLRALAAWLLAGAAAGCLVAALHRPRPGPAPALTAFALGAAVVIVLSGAAARALSHNQPLLSQLGPELGATATGFAWGVLVAGAGAAALALQGARRRG